LKSGCARGALDSAASACQKLARQVAPLKRWIDEQVKSGADFAILGDFNRDLQAEKGPARGANEQPLALWPAINDGASPGSILLNAATGTAFRNCAVGQRYSSYIDQIVLGKRLASRMVPGSFERLTWKPIEAARLTLSDHCPIAIRIRIPSSN
jgi:exonuclease III